MTDTAQIQAFTDAESYEKFMGQWSRVVSRLFLDWLSLPKNLTWLDVGCGTGAFTETIQQTCAPAEIVAIDPAPAQIAYAQSRKSAAGAQFLVVDARSMSFEAAGLTDVETRSIEIPVTFQDFDDYWNSNTTFASPIGGNIKSLSGEKRQRLMELVKSRLPINAQDVIAYKARGNSIRGRA
jgi:SAM-dependent methyltransferase